LTLRKLTEIRVKTPVKVDVEFRDRYATLLARLEVWEATFLATRRHVVQARFTLREQTEIRVKTPVKVDVYFRDR
jgi:hypothetical protein